MFITCFDAATSTGCCDGIVGGEPRYWSWHLQDAGKGRPQRLLYLWNFLGAYFTENRIDRAFIEAPVRLAAMMEIGTSDDTLQFLRSIIGVIELACAAHEIPVGFWTPIEARKAVIGRGTFPRGMAKKEVMKFCRMLKHDPEDDNAADALIGWYYESALLNPRTALHTTPLFGEIRE